MRFFTKNVSKVLVGALLATTVVGELTKVVRHVEDLDLALPDDRVEGRAATTTRATTTKRAATTTRAAATATRAATTTTRKGTTAASSPTSSSIAGSDPSTPDKRSAYSKYCKTVVPKKGVRRDVAAEDVFNSTELLADVLAVRAMPAGYTPVTMGSAAAQGPEGPGLFSDQFGTCPGIAVVGTARPAGQPGTGKSNFLAHISLGQNWNEIKTQINDLAALVQQSGVRNPRAVVYTVDTRPSNPELADDDMKFMARNLEDNYKEIAMSMQRLIGANGQVTRVYHDFGHVGEMVIEPAGRVIPRDS